MTDITPSQAPAQTTEEEQRAKVVGVDQRLTELAAADAAAAGYGAVMVVITETPMTPGYLNPNNIEEFELDGETLFRLKKGEEPLEGLMPAAKAGNPKQASTVYGRTVSLEKAANAGVQIVCIYVNDDRKNPDDPSKTVFPQKGSWSKKHKEVLIKRTISKSRYIDEVMGKLPAASYLISDKNGNTTAVVISAPQIKDTDSNIKICSCLGPDADRHVEKVSTFLEKLGLLTMAQMVAKSGPHLPEKKTDQSGKPQTLERNN